MSAIQKQLKELQQKAQDAWVMLDLDHSQERVHDLEVVMNAADFWSDQEGAKKISQEASERKDQIEIWQTLIKEIEDALDMLALAAQEDDDTVQKEVEQTTQELQKRFDKLELQTLLSDDQDANNVILTIHAGAGGTDAMDWAGMLLRMLHALQNLKVGALMCLRAHPGKRLVIRAFNYQLRVGMRMDI